MSRPQRCRRICSEPAFTEFSPSCARAAEPVELCLDEFEVIRLVDLQRLTHEQCAAQMDISRTTATEIYESARRKIADCIVNGYRMVISGGNYRLCDGSAVKYCMKRRGTAKNCRFQQEGGNMRKCEKRASCRRG